MNVDGSLATDTETLTHSERRLERVVTLPAPAPGFIGEGHTVVPVVDPSDFVRQDPFIVLMDDRLDLPPGREAGGEHPHAGFETVTLMLEGELHDRDEGVLRAGDLQWMTAGSGIIHSENVVPHGVIRLLQLWLTLPSSARWTAPRFETVRHEAAPVRREPGVEVRVYSGRSGAAHSETRNHVPVTLLDVRLAAGATVVQELPASYNGFVYVIEGDATVGDDKVGVRTGQVAWLDRPTSDGSSVLRLRGGSAGARLVLYAGEPQHAPLVTHGPFVGETRADLVRASTDYMAGRFPRMSALMRASAGAGLEP
jgi:redox-sensitive bicupin YhaK (pirin superfamily)